MAFVERLIWNWYSQFLLFTISLINRFYVPLWSESRCGDKIIIIGYFVTINFGGARGKAREREREPILWAIGFHTWKIYDHRHCIPFHCNRYLMAHWQSNSWSCGILQSNFDSPEQSHGTISIYLSSIWHLTIYIYGSARAPLHFVRMFIAVSQTIDSIRSQMGWYHGFR